MEPDNTARSTQLDKKRIIIKETPGKVGESVRVAGWVNVRRDHGPIVFIDLRDRSGLLQVVFGDGYADKALVAKIRPEWVVEIEGKIVKRPDNMVNSEREAGSVELKAEKLTVLNESETPPFNVAGDGHDINEELRLKYRYLDLRRERLQKNLSLRHEILNHIRSYLTDKNFIEIETPLLTKSTPEGARDYIVPSRTQKGKFYALPQSPQQYKQLLMVAGFERYFQVARAMRDEDTRGDRQPEFSQLDIEMSFSSQEEILELTEALALSTVRGLSKGKITLNTPFPRMTYKEAMEKYGTDKPDLRENKKDSSELSFVFVTDFPMFEKKEDGTLVATHHPFTMPKEDDVEKIKTGSLDILSWQHDLVLNGQEIGGGSIRSHKPEILQASFEALGHSKEDISQQFGHIFEAFKYGVPPHGGIAVGLDRLLMVLTAQPNIREVMAFPKTGDGRDLMMASPSEASKNQLDELGIEIKKED